MDNKELKKQIDNLLIPVGFKRKGNNWKLENEELEKVVNLQKSNFNNSYYINYGYNLKKLDYDRMLIHISNRLAHSDNDKNTLIDNTLNLEVELSLQNRVNGVKEIISEILLPEIESINCETDIVNMLKKRPHLNDIPLKVKEYLKFY